MLVPWVTAPETAAVLTDFDGTLAPMVDDPAMAAPLPGVEAVLGRLAGRYGRVAVISGRPVVYLQRHLGGASGVELVGLYGLERARDGLVEQLPAARQWRGAVESAAAAAEAAAPPGVGVERKGLAVTLHVRADPSLAGWVEGFATAQAAATGLRAHPGKMSVELRPPVLADKGTVVTELAAGMAAVFFLGDDLADLAAFAALAALRAAGTVTMAVAVGSDEAPAPLLAAADLVVAGPLGAVALLARLAGRD